MLTIRTLSEDEQATRMQQYLDHIRKAAPHLTQNEHYIVVDGSFANAAFISGVTNLNKDDQCLWSIGSVKILAFNQHYLNRIIRIFGLDETCIKKQPEYQSLTQYGTLAA